MSGHKTNKHSHSIDGNTMIPGQYYRIRIWDGESPPKKETNDDDDGEKITFINYVDEFGSVITEDFRMNEISNRNKNCYLNLNGNNIIIYGDKGVWWFDINNIKNRVTFLRMP